MSARNAPPSHQAYCMLPRLLEKRKVIETVNALNSHVLFGSSGICKKQILPNFFWKTSSAREHRRNELFHMSLQGFSWIFAEGSYSCCLCALNLKQILELMLADGCFSLWVLVVETTKIKWPSKSKTDGIFIFLVMQFSPGHPGTRLYAFVVVVVV